MRLLDILKSSTELLKESGIDEPSHEAEILILYAAGTDRLTAYRDNPEIRHNLVSKINKLLERRANGEPVQYIVGYVNFLNVKIKVGRGVLIPRPETELLAQEAINELRIQIAELKTKKPGYRSRKEFIIQNPASNISTSFHVLDLCTGSGCIPLAIARELPDVYIYGIDISKTAIRYAKTNADINRIKNVTFMKGSLFEPIKEPLSFDLIISNPPYIKTADMNELQREIKDWEPLEALDGGIDGLDYYRKILAGAGKFLNKERAIMLELGFGQAQDVAEIAIKNGFRNISIKKDFAGIDRILKAEI